MTWTLALPPSSGWSVFVVVLAGRGDLLEVAHDLNFRRDRNLYRLTLLRLSPLGLNGITILGMSLPGFFHNHQSRYPNNRSGAATVPKEGPRVGSSGSGLTSSFPKQEGPRRLSC